MTSQAFALREDATLSQAAFLMASERIHRVVVVSANGKIAGLVSALDVLRWMASAKGGAS
jgi:CBS domain-containing protein